MKDPIEKLTALMEGLGIQNIPLFIKKANVLDYKLLGSTYHDRAIQKIESQKKEFAKMPLAITVYTKAKDLGFTNFEYWYNQKNQDK